MMHRSRPPRSFGGGGSGGGGEGTGAGVGPGRAEKPPLTIFPTTLWEYPSQHYDAFVNERGEVVRSRARPPSPRPTGGDGPDDPHAMQGDQAYVGATPSWVIWQCLMRYTRPGDMVVDPMCGSGTTLDVAADVGRRARGFDLQPQRPEITKADARSLPIPPGVVDFVFVDPPYSTHVKYSDDPRCIGKLDAMGEDEGHAYFTAMDKVAREIRRVLKPGGAMGLYVSDSFRITQRAGRHVFSPIGLMLLDIFGAQLEPIDIISVVRHNQKLERGNWRRAAVEGNYYLRGFNYLLLLRKGTDSPADDGDDDGEEDFVEDDE